jgi:isoquinoline 1-oxidoreductase beta subunit
VLHPPTGRSAKYGELAANAARLPVPQNVPLKRQQDFKLIGTPAKRLDTPAKVNGTAVYGIDARPPGVKIATLAQSPVDQARRVFNNPHELRELRQTRDMGAR